MLCSWISERPRRKVKNESARKQEVVASSPEPCLEPEVFAEPPVQEEATPEQTQLLQMEQSGDSLNPEMAMSDETGTNRCVIKEVKENHT